MNDLISIIKEQLGEAALSHNKTLTFQCHTHREMHFLTIRYGNGQFTIACGELECSIGYYYGPTGYVNRPSIVVEYSDPSFIEKLKDILLGELGYKPQYE